MTRRLESSVGVESGHPNAFGGAASPAATPWLTQPRSEAVLRPAADRDAVPEIALKRLSVASASRPDRAVNGRLGVEVVFATRGRAPVVAEVVRALDRQILRPHAVTLSCNTRADAGHLADRSNIRLLVAGDGLAQQRNRALQNSAPGTDIVVFFDDFFPHEAWIEAVERRFRSDPHVVAVTGNVVADGSKGPGMSFDQAAVALIRHKDRRADADRTWYSPYGCNMAFRRSAIADLAFDERLILYGWLKDRDFDGALAKRGGRLIRLGEALGVHLGVKAGRLSGRRIGHSQVVNPVYLRQKGTITTLSLIWHVFKNITSNAARSFCPEPYGDRSGRLRGIIRGAAEIVSGRASPERALLL